MNGLPCVLGLDAAEAQARLLAAGCTAVEVLVTGRRKEGRLRVVRQSGTPQAVVLTATHFRPLRGQPSEPN